MPNPFDTPVAVQDTRRLQWDLLKLIMHRIWPHFLVQASVIRRWLSFFVHTLFYCFILSPRKTGMQKGDGKFARRIGRRRWARDEDRDHKNKTSFSTECAHAYYFERNTTYVRVEEETWVTLVGRCGAHRFRNSRRGMVSFKTTIDERSFLFFFFSFLNSFRQGRETRFRQEIVNPTIPNTLCEENKIWW